MTTEIERERLVDYRCPPDCPHPQEDEWHEAWAERCANGAPHRHDGRQMTHAHFPKKGMGGNNPLSKVVAYICWPLHDSVDNGLNGMGIALGEVRFWDVHNNTILRGPVGASSDGGEGKRDGRSPADDLPPSPDATGVSTAEGERGRLPRPREGLWASSDGPVSLSAADASSDSDASTSSEGAGPPAPSPHLADDAGRDSREFGPTLSPAAVTEPSGFLSGPPSIAEALMPNGLELPDEFTFKQWTELAKMVTGMNINRQWWAGDLILAGERFGERATQHWNDLGYKYESLANCVRVCRRFPRPLRHESLQFSHHAVLYALPDEEALYFLEEAYDHGWTVKQLREAVHGVKPRTVRFTLFELRERLAAWPGDQAVRNNARRWAAAFLESLE